MPHPLDTAYDPTAWLLGIDECARTLANPRKPRRLAMLRTPEAAVAATGNAIPSACWLVWQGLLSWDGETCEITDRGHAVLAIIDGGA